MKTKTCGDCKYFVLKGHCTNNNGREDSCNDACSFFEQKVITNGDRIRRYSNDELANHCRKPLCLSCIHAEHPNDDCVRCGAPSAVDCIKGYLAWLNAPAESERKDED